ncbi:MAG: chemotaxis protein CheX [Bdellovibrionales bacterium]|nr:chemotaxis protein CheX [Bdellovibrionales bacterium]
MNVEYINPFIDATLNVLKTMASFEAFHQTPQLKPDKKTWGVVTGMIGLAGDDVAGMLMLSFDEASILQIVSNLFGTPYTAINDEVTDAVGEITNMICGGAKSALAEKGYKINMATPTMIVGKDVAISQLSTTPIVTVPFEGTVGRFVIEASLTRKKSST